MKSLEPVSIIDPIAVRPAVAAKALGMSTVSLWRLEVRGLIKAIPGTGGRGGAIKLFSVSELKRFAAEGLAAKADDATGKRPVAA